MERRTGHAAHQMILASAGSGKTFQLVNRMIGLVARGADPESIIALTFTRKAAGEFADAVLTRLAEAALDPDKAERLRGDVTMGEADPTELLQRVVRALPCWMLGTMDGFFNRVLRAFPCELGLSGGTFELVEGPRARMLQERLLERTLVGSGHEAMDGEFVRTFRRATMGREDVGVLDPLRKHVEVWQDLLLEAEDWEWGPMPEGVELEAWEREKHSLAASVRDGLTAVEYTDRRQKAAMEHLLDALENHTIGSGGIAEKAGRLFDFLVEDVAAATGGPIRFSLYRPFAVTGSAVSGLRRMIALCAQCEVVAAALRTRAIRRVVASYDALAGREMRSKGLLGFRDVKHLMGRWAHDEDARLRREQVDYRLDASLRHWLLDEFQDTSRSDWRGISPLVDEVMSSGDGSLFIVGDRKQAIYGWRGGDVTLFDDIFERYREQMDRRPMSDSYRSCPEVLALVNRVCGNMDGIRSLFGRVADRWHWEDHVSAPHLRVPDQAGEAFVEVLGDWEARQHRTLEILRERGVGRRRMTCGVLLRDNKKAALMADFLRAQGLDVVLDGARKPATDSPVGWLVLQTVRWLADPADSFARNVIWMSPAGRAWLTEHGGSWSRTWLTLTSNVASAGFAAALQAWIEPHVGGWSPYGRASMDDLLEALRRMDGQGVCSAREAADWIENLEMAQAPGLADVQVMTVHKSKGLGFDMVVIPDVPDDKLPQAQHFDIARSVSARWILETPPQWVRRVVPGLQAAGEEWEECQRYEAMCLLYVALTRAKSCLAVLLDRPGDKADPNKPSLANWLRHALDEKSDDVLFREGSMGWTERFPESGFEGQEERVVQLGQAVPKRLSTVATKEHALSAGVVFGMEVHRLLESVEWTDEAQPILPDTVAGALARDIIEEESLGWIFRREGREIDLWREQAVDARMGSHHFSGMIDRMLVYRECGRIVRIDIVDWKTDAVREPSELVARHSNQMKTYREVIGRAYKDAEIRCFLVSVQHRRAVEV